MRRIAVQIGLSYLALTTLTVGIGAVAAGLLTDLSGAIGQTMSENVQSLVAVERMGRALAGQEAARDAVDPAAFDEAARAFREAVETGRRAAYLPDEPALLDSIEAAHAAYTTEAGPTEAGNETRATDLVARLNRLATRLAVLNEQAAEERAAEARAASDAARRLLLLAVACAVLASLVAGLVFARRISRPLRELTAGVAEVGRGRFDRRVDGSAGGEVGALAEAFNEMGTRLQAYEALNVRALVREKRTAESLVAAMPSPVLVTEGPDARVRLLNAAAERLLGPAGPSGPVLGRPLAETLPGLSTLGDEGLVELGPPGETRTFRLRRTRVDVPAEADADRPAALPADRLAVLLLDDVTPFRELDAARSGFLAAVSHELRTPLTSMHMALDLLARGAADPLPPAQRELMDIVREDAGRMRRLVARLLDLARVEVGGRPTGPVDLPALAARAADGLRLVAAERGVALTVEAPGAVPAVEGDADGLTMAISNLVANAVRHARSRVAVRVQAEDVEDGPAGAVSVHVEDDGPGLPPGTEDRVFEPLVQLADGSGSPPGSAGLGLTIVRRVAEAHGGRAWATAGPGGRFTLALPAAASAPDVV